mmetsp:Transcript_1402/g.4115  ORF Transcript_1402/g.4115 Transcript_1402/m.4115 type:complete len:229 (-) Transcript_1402:1072-1758(-)
MRLALARLQTASESARQPLVQPTSVGPRFLPPPLPRLPCMAAICLRTAPAVAPSSKDISVLAASVAAFCRALARGAVCWNLCAARRGLAAASRATRAWLSGSMRSKSSSSSSRSSSPAATAAAAADPSAADAPELGCPEDGAGEAADAGLGASSASRGAACPSWPAQPRNFASGGACTYSSLPLAKSLRIMRPVRVSSGRPWPMTKFRLAATAASTCAAPARGGSVTL